MVFWHDIRLLHTTANGLMMFACAALAAAGLNWFAHRPMFELGSVEVVPVEGQSFRRVSAARLEAAEAGRLSGNFFTVNLGAVRQGFEEAPWVRHAEVRRIWPNRLRVVIEEHQPIAHWKGGGLVNTHGEWFDPTPNDDRSDVAVATLAFSGPEGTQAIVKRQYDDISLILRPLGVKPVAVRLSDRQAWSATLSDGLELLMGRESDVPIHDRLVRWSAVHAQLQQRLNGSARVIDLRYPNGFAVRAPDAIGKPMDRAVH